MGESLTGAAAALGSALAWAIGAILFKRIGDGLSSSFMTLVKCLISALLLGGLLLAMGGRLWLPRHTLLMLLVSGALGVALGATLLFAALKRLAPHTLIVLFTGGQVLTVLLAIVFLGDKPAPLGWIGIALILAGIFFVLRSSLADDAQSTKLLGVVLGALSVVCMSVSLVIAKKALASVGSVEGAFLRMFGGAVAMLGFSLFYRRKGVLAPLRDGGLMLRFFAGVAVITFGGFWLSLLAVKLLDLSVASVLSSAEPIFVLILGALFLRERITLQALLGVIVAVAGVSCLCVALHGA